MDFNLFKSAVAKQFEMMRKHDLFRSEATKDELWDTYLASFPAGSNPILKERTEHDCTCCKQFIRSIGDVVAVIDGKLVSIWDVTVNEPAYQVVTDALSALVHSKPIADTFLSVERVAGTEKTFSDTVKGVQTWNHFFLHIPSGKKGDDKNYVVAGADIGTRLNASRTKKEVFKRGLDELTLDSIDTVIELIAQNSLYRGQEFKFMVDEFRKEKLEYAKVKAKDKDNYVWAKSIAVNGAVSGLRGSMLGSLLIDLDDGVELEDAVKKYEAKAGAANYKRPTALVTKSMVENAKKKIEELGLTSALERRYANLSDINVNDILFADRQTKSFMSGDVFDEIANKVPQNTKKLDKVEEVTIDKFVSDILPHAESLEVMLENEHASNLVSLIAPVDETAGAMFKWDNKFSWSYNGDLADSIKERVKQAGGNVTGDVCCRLAWNNTDDLDFHMKEPSGHVIYYGNRRMRSGAGGMLDVDANGCSGMMENPVENIFYSRMSDMKEGTYELSVKQFSKRSSTNIGFEVEIDIMGDVYRFSHEHSMSSGTVIQVAKFTYSKADGVTMLSSLPTTKSVKSVWGIQTNTFQKVDVVMMSPNYWGDHGVGNKHFFFMVDGCKNDGQARGFYNEFLKEELTPHRKVIEIVGSKMRAKETENQLSGVGFSSTKRSSVMCRVKGKFARVVKVVF